MAGTFSAGIHQASFDVNIPGPDKGSRNRNRWKSRVPASSPMNRSHSARGSASRGSGGMNRPCSVRQSGVRTKSSCHQRHQRSNVRRVTPKVTRNAASLLPAISFRAADSRIMAVVEYLRRPIYRTDAGVVRLRHVSQQKLILLALRALERSAASSATRGYRALCKMPPQCLQPALRTLPAMS